MRWIVGACFVGLSACQCGAPETTVVVIPVPQTVVEVPIAPEPAAERVRPAAQPVAAAATQPGGWVEQLENADEATKTDRVVDNVAAGDLVRRSAEAPNPTTPVEDEAVASEPEPGQSVDDPPVVPSELHPEPTTAAIEVAQPAANREPIPWLEQYRSAYIDRQIALSDVTVQLANPQVGVYIEDYRALGVEEGTPHQSWLGTREMQAVSPSVEALLLGRTSERLGQVPTFSCDPSKYACRSLDGAPLGAYYRFAPFGSARTVQLVGVLYYDPSVRSATTNTRIDAFNRAIDAQLSRLE